MNQRKYALELIGDMGLNSAKIAHTPLEQNVKYTSAEFDTHVDIKDSDKELLAKPERFRQLIGKLLYLTITRPDIAYSVQTLSQFMSNPEKSHYDAALRIVRYVKKSPGQGILMKKQNREEYIAYCDSDWGGSLETRRSISGYMVTLGDSLISWKVKKQLTVARSSAEAEFRCMASTVAEVIWLRGIGKELQLQLSKPTTLYCDNKAALQIAKNPVFHERTKHIDIDCYFVREAIQDQTIETAHVTSKEQIADLFTKPLGRQPFEYLKGKLSVKDLFHPQFEGGCEKNADSASTSASQSAYMASLLDT